MTEYFGEFVGTFLLILLGNGVVANVNLDKTHSFGAGWIVIAAGWGMAVFVAVFTVSDLSGAHINPAVTLGLAFSGIFPWAKVIPFIIAQMLGAMFAAAIVYLYFIDHFKITSDPAKKKACFCTAPAIRNYKINFFSEVIGTFVLVFAVLFIHLPSIEISGVENAKVGLGSLEALPVGLLVFSIGLSLGGTTGYAINPARDFGPRIAYAIIPMKNKAGSDWKYSWIPSLGPVAGAAVASGLYLFILFSVCP
jgi:glycerol uptake facilitator protein